MTQREKSQKQRTELRRMAFPLETRKGKEGGKGDLKEKNYEENQQDVNALAKIPTRSGQITFLSEFSVGRSF